MSFPEGMNHTVDMDRPIGQDGQVQRGDEHQERLAGRDPAHGLDGAPGLAADLLRLIVPQPCPVPLIRLGGDSDGAYLVPDDLAGIAACFSPGVNNFKNFEDALVHDYGIKTHMCDYSSDIDKLKTPLIPGMQTFDKKWLGFEKNPTTISLPDWVGEYASDPGLDLMLQMDIEGAEYRNIPIMPDYIMKRFRIIVIEVHALRRLQDPHECRQKLAPLLRKLAKHHVCVHAHPNNCSGEFIEPETGMNVPLVLELTYLRRDRFQGDPAQWYGPQLPHPLDIARNSGSIAPLQLNCKWLASGEKSHASQLKELQDALDFSQHQQRRQARQTRRQTAATMATMRAAIANLYATLAAVPDCQSVAADVQVLRTSSAELAFGKPFILSSSYDHFPVDGTIASSGQFFFHTDFEPYPSITIDLQEPHQLDFLVITNRMDCHQARASSLAWICHDTPAFNRDDCLPVCVQDVFLEPNGGPSVTPLFGKKGRYFTILSCIKTALHFSRIEIFSAS